jgi:hypothetical protein
MTTEFQRNIEELQYSVDVLKEYVDDLNSNKSGNRVFQLGKIEAAFEELKIRYNCLYDVVMEQAQENNKNGPVNNDTIHIKNAADGRFGDYMSGYDFMPKIPNDIWTESKNFNGTINFNKSEETP